MKGSIRKRVGKKRTVWTIVYDAQVDGKRKQLRETVGSEKEAERLLRKRLTEVEAGALPERRKTTFTELATEFLTSKTAIEVTTRAWYDRALRLHVLPAIGAKHVEKLRESDVEEMLANAVDVSNRKREDRALGASTPRDLLVLVRSVLAFGIKRRYLTFNVAANVDVPAQEHREQIAWTPELVGRVLDAARGTDLESIVAFALASGLRRGEVVALRWGDVDLESGTISVRRSAKKVDKRDVIGKTKTVKSQRSFVLPAFAVDDLKRHRVAQLEQRIALGMGRAAAHDVVFDRVPGEPWKLSLISQRFGRLMRRKKLPPIRFHDLRHGSACLDFAAGTPLKVVNEKLGHSSIAVTSQIYVDVLEETQREAAGRLDSHIGDVFRRRSS